MAHYLDIDQLFSDVHFKFRQSLVEVEDKDFGQVTMPNVAAKFSRTPCRSATQGQDRGESNREIYSGLLGLTEEEIKRLQEIGAI